MTDSPRAALVLDGPSWWAQPTVWPNGTVVDVKKAAEFRLRSEAATLERAAMARMFEAVPAGYLVLHPVERGAGFVWAEVANAAGFSAVAIAGDDLSFHLVALAAGLQKSGWKVSARIAGPTSGVYLGMTPASERWLTTCAYLADASIPFKYVPPLTAEELAADDEPGS